MNSIRNPLSKDIPALVQIWHDGWHEAHARHVPKELVDERTWEDFDRRLGAMLDQTRVIGPLGKPIGFCTVRQDELMHLFVSPDARGTDTATNLLGDGENRLKGYGVRAAWLACIIGNDRAAHFYEREGWKRTGEMEYCAETLQGTFRLNEWKYEKRL